MKIKVVSLALVLGLAALLGACAQEGGGGGGESSPSPAESPAESPTTSPPEAEQLGWESAPHILAIIPLL